jgi:hypothetical protein
VALHWLDEPSIDRYRIMLKEFGYLPMIRFNKVLDIALASRRLKRRDIYMTQAFHLIPQGRSERIPLAAIDASFSEITRHECHGRKSSHWASTPNARVKETAFPVLPYAIQAAAVHQMRQTLVS